MRKNLLLVFAALFLMTAVSGCKMVKGAGKDIENAGKHIQKTADENN